MTPTDIKRRNSQVVTDSLKRKQINETNAKNYANTKRSNKNILCDSCSVCSYCMGDK